MMRIYQIVLATTVLMGAVSCVQQEVENVETETIVVEEETDKSSPKMVELQLKNEREKWKVNQEMYEYPQNCKQMVNKYLKEEDTDYLRLANQLDGQTKKLIATCTMTGESHDALHLWLEPNMEMIAELQAASTDKEAQPVVLKLNESYREFDKYFE